MPKYKIQLIDNCTGIIEEDFVDEISFTSQIEAEDYAMNLNSLSEVGAEVMMMSNPGDYEAEYGNCNYSYIVAEI